MNYIYAYLYLLISFFYIFNGKIINKYYMGFLIFCFIRIIFNYRKCTLSYIEYKLRGVKKENGILYNFLNEITNLRYSNHYYFLLLIVFYILNYNFR